MLIDADLRRGELHETFDILREPGLSELMVGALDAREVIRPDVCRGLDLLPAGKRPPNPSELLGSRAMAEMLDSWREEYRWILLDAPPVLAVTDAANPPGRPAPPRLPPRRRCWYPAAVRGVRDNLD